MSPGGVPGLRCPYGMRVGRLSWSRSRRPTGKQLKENSQTSSYDRSSASVDPACAGIFRQRGRTGSRPVRRPRVRGDLPTSPTGERTVERSTPRARGSSAAASLVGVDEPVDPACAGIFRAPSSATAASPSRPRVRGDLPRGGGWCRVGRRSTPRARGSPAGDPPGGRQQLVDPACAGIPRSATPGGRSAQGRPRVRGDPPVPLPLTAQQRESTPRARGSSGARLRLASAGGVVESTPGMRDPAWAVFRTRCDRE